MTKDELRAELERQEQRYKEVYGGEVTTYALSPNRNANPGVNAPPFRTRLSRKNCRRWKRNSKPKSHDRLGLTPFKGLRLPPLKAGCIDVAIRARYERAAVTSSI